MDIKQVWPGWEVVRKIGSGSFGNVYEIQRDVFGVEEKAALKVLSIPRSADEVDELRAQGHTEPEISTIYKDHLQQIVREYSIMSQIRGHANVVNCDDVKYVSHEDGIGWDIYIKMELLIPLMKALNQVNSEAQVVKLGQDICSALVRCKDRNIIHRDIKPQNIFVSEDGTYKLGDFGIAKTADRTSGGTRIGTYKYMAPEVYNNHPYGAAADVYSLGMVLYYMLNDKRTPFLPPAPQVVGTGDEEQAGLRRFRGEAIPEPKYGSPELKRIVLKACAYASADRYTSAAEMLADLKALDNVSAAVFPLAVHHAQAPAAAVKEVSADTVVLNGQETMVLEDQGTVILEDQGTALLEDVEQVQLEILKKKKKSAFFAFIGALALLIVLLLILLLKSCDGAPVDDGKGSTTTAPTMLSSVTTISTMGSTPTTGNSTTAQTTMPTTNKPTSPFEIPLDANEFAPIEVIVNRGANTRKGPGTSYDVFERLYDGDKLTIYMEFTENGRTWALSDKGWVATECLKLPDDNALSLNRSDFTLTKSDSQWRLYDGDLDVSKITWSSSNTNVATVKNGVVTAVGNGSATITAKYEGQNVTCNVYVSGFDEIPGNPVGLEYEVNQDGKTCQIIGIGSFTGSKLDIPNSIDGYTVTAVGAEAFRNCNSITAITIPGTVATIDESAFRDCNNISTFVIPKSVSFVANTALVGCDSLTSIQVESGNQYYIAENGVLYSASKDTLVAYPSGRGGAFTVPNSVLTVGSYAFCGSHVGSVSIPESIFIAEHAFHNCNDLTSVSLGDSLASIGAYAFAGCKTLNTIELPENLRNIGNGAFYECSEIVGIIIPRYVESIGVAAFASCQKLLFLRVDSGNQYFAIQSNALYSKDGSRLVAFPAGVEGANVTYGAKTIEDYAFHGCSLSEFGIYDVEMIGKEAFWGCKKIQNVIIPTSVKTIGEGTFKYCEKLTSITYAGTKAQWNAIQKGTDWDSNTGNYTIHCTDGDIPKA